MASGRLILPPADPVINSDGAPVVGAILSVFGTGTDALADLFADADMTTPIANPLTADSAGYFYEQTTVIWADAASAYDAELDLGNGQTFTYEALYLLGAATNTSGFAPIDSPAFTGVPTAPTPASNDSSAKLATTAFVGAQDFAPLISPAFSGAPTAPTAAVGTNTTQLATTAFVAAEIAAEAAASYYQSGAITVTGGANGTLSHGLGANPTRVQVVYICTSPIQQYIAGDEVPMIYNYGDGTNYGCLAWVVNDSATLKYQFAQDGTKLINASGDDFNATSANFSARIRAWLR